jgi:hypothetical protein
MNLRKRHIIEISPELGDMKREIIKNLKSENTFQRDGKLVRAVEAKALPDGRLIVDLPPVSPDVKPVSPDVKPVSPDVKTKHTIFPSGNTIIRELTLSQTKELLCDEFYFLKRTEQGDKQCVPSDDIASIVKDNGEYPNIDVILGVTQYPYIQPNGNINYIPGYDKFTGYFYQKTCELEPLNRKITQEMARNSLENLVEIFCDFPFVSKKDKYVPISAGMSLVARPMLLGHSIPIFACDASVAGSGKSLIFDIIHNILNGCSMPKAQWNSGGDGTEIPKCLSSIAKAGSSSVLFDNVTFDQHFGHPSLDAAVTAQGQVEFRILGVTQIFRCEWTTIVFVNGNNIMGGFKNDTIRRTLSFRIESDMERPQERTDFKYPEIIQHVKYNRSRYINDMLTILKGFIQAGCPQLKKFTWGSFQKWAELIPAAIVWAGGENIIEDINKNYSENIDYQNIDGLFELLQKRYLMGFRAIDLYEIINNDREPEIKHKFFEIFGDPRKITPKKIGNFLADYQGRIINGKKMVSTGDLKNSRQWNIVDFKKGDKIGDKVSNNNLSNNVKNIENNNKKETIIKKELEKDLFYDIITKEKVDDRNDYEDIDFEND